RLFHNFEVYSERVITSAREWAFPDVEHPASFASLRIGLWICVILGFGLSLVGMLNLLHQKKMAENPTSDITLTNPKKFVWAKLWLWLIAFPVSALVMFLYVLIPLPSPTFNLIYGGFLGGYGLLMLLLHWFGKMPGVTGKLRNFRFQAASLNDGWRWAILFNLVLFASITILYRSGIGLAPPVGVRFAWLLIFLPLTALGFWLGMLEADALSLAAPGKSSYRILSVLISLLPFYLYLILLIALGSTSGVLASLTGLLILAVSILQGEITRILTGNYLVSALLQALLIFWLILPTGSLFTPFF
ncbi:MAG: hypothetical protein R3307_01960, partial [Anaerolineales bacterium]|nr:hypothetical protein [Anaerolineales bacterium]